MWNIAGAGTIFKCKEFFDDMDLILLQETWVEKSREEAFPKKLNTQFRWGAMAAIRRKKWGRASRGIIVGIRKKLAKKIELKEWEFVLIIKGIELGEEKIDVITVYNNGKFGRLIKSLREIMEETTSEGNRFVIAGDLNVRVGQMQIDRGRFRKSEDSKLNAEGKKLLEAMAEFNGEIRNGCTASDSSGRITFVGDAGSSVLDLVLEGGAGTTETISDVRVITRMEPDHLPVTFYIPGAGEIEREQPKINVHKQEKLKWKEKMSKEYEALMKEKWSGLEFTGKNAQEKWDMLLITIKEVAGDLKMQVGNSSAGINMERDRPIREQKKVVRGRLNEWLKTKDVKEREYLKRAKVELKEMIARKRREKNEEKFQKMVKCKDMKDFSGLRDLE